MTKMDSSNVFAIITAVKHWGNSREVSTAVRKNFCEVNTAVSYQEN